MPIDWSDNILLAELSNEPELAEELSAIFDRLKIANTATPGGPKAKGGADSTIPSVVLNFAAVSYLNSSHIAAMLRMRKRLMECGRSLVLCSLGEQIWSVMGLTGLDRVFQFAPDPMTALATVQLQDQRNAPRVTG